MASTKPRKNLHRQIVEEIGLSIVRGDIKAGETFPSEPELSLQLGVSRTVVREAIKILSDKGMVQSRSKLGTQIQPRYQWHMLDPDVLAWEYAVEPHEAFLYKLTEVRRVIEPYACKLAATHATDEELTTIEAHFQQMVASVETLDTFIAADMAFHSSILRASHNEILEHIINTIGDALVTSRKVTLALPNTGRESLPLHQNVLLALQAHDASAAQTAMEILIDSVKADIDRSVNLPQKGVASKKRENG